MAPDRDHDRPRRRDSERDAIQGLFEKGASSKEGHVLLRPIISAYTLRQGP